MRRQPRPAGISADRGRRSVLTQGGPEAVGTEGAPPGFDIKKGGLGSAAQALALATLCGVLFLTFLDNTVVSVGLANVQSDLHAGVTSLQWVVNGYALTFASFMLVAGMLGDIFGRKRVMLVGVAIFCGGSVVAALAGNVDWLIAGRVDHGHRRRGQRARHAVHHQARLPGPRDTCRRPRRVGRGFGPRAGPGSRHRRLARRILELAGHLLVQPGLRCRRLRPGGRGGPRDVRPAGATNRRAGVRVRRRFPRLHVVRRDSG